MRIFLVFIFVFISNGLRAQDLSMEKLQILEDEELLTLFNEVEGDSIKQEIVARAYLERGRKEKDTIKMARGYDRLARIFNPQKNISFADSVIELSDGISNRTYPALGYMLKGHWYQRLGNLELAVKNSLKAYELAVLNNNIGQQISISDYLIFSKAIWGDKRQALELQRKRHALMMGSNYSNEIKSSTRDGALDHLEDIYLENELSSIMNFVYCHLSLKTLDSARIYLEEGLEKSLTYKGYTNNKDYYYRWFLAALVELDFHSKDYLECIKTSNQLLSMKSTKEDISTMFNLCFFKGFSFIHLDEYDVGVNYLMKADSIFDENTLSVLPNDRHLFEQLLNHYTEIGDSAKQIEYLNKLIFADSIFKKNYQFFEPDLIKNFETPELIKEKEALIAGLEKKNQKSNSKFWWSMLILSICLIALIYYFKRQLVYKRRFENLLQQREDANEESVKINSSSMEISSKIIEEILSGLTLFEFNKEYLSPNTSLSELANSLSTNPRYLSKVINLQKDNNFPQYINDLRVDYAIKEMSENSKFRKYSIRAIAEECGFKSAESFSKSFYKKHGIYPSYYIKKMENIRNKTSSP